MAIQTSTGTFAATGNGTAFTPENSQDRRTVAAFNIALYGTFVGTVLLEKSFDAGVNWIPVYRPATATAVSYTAPGAEVLAEPEDGVQYRWRCSAYTSGTVNYRLSQ